MGADGKCFSYTNDASLLLPANAFGHEYRVISRATRAVRTSAGLIEQSSFSPGFFTVVATAPGESRVAVTFTGATSAGSGSVLRAYKKGETGYFTLQQWDVLQVLSQVPSTCTPDSETKTVEGGVTITLKSGATILGSRSYRERLEAAADALGGGATAKGDCSASDAGKRRADDPPARAN